MPTVSLASSPLNPGVSPVEIFYRDEGSGVPLVLLHGGWGNGLNPFNRQLEKLRHGFRVICPDRSGYGRSTRLAAELPSDFHFRAVAETLALLDALGIDRAFFWGHSDGAVIAAIIGFSEPGRVRGLILEAFHYDRVKLARASFLKRWHTARGFGRRTVRKICARIRRRRMARGHHQSRQGMDTNRA